MAKKRKRHVAHLMKHGWCVQWKHGVSCRMTKKEITGITSGLRKDGSPYVVKKDRKVVEKWPKR